MPTITATQARGDWFQLLKQVAKGAEYQRILSKEGGVVLVSEDYFDSLLETAELLSIPGFMESMKEGERQIERGELIDADEIFKDL